MAKEITIQDCRELYEKFLDYARAAEQHEFTILSATNLMLRESLRDIEEGKVSLDSDGVRAMFHATLTLIGDEDAKLYKKEN